MQKISMVHKIKQYKQTIFKKTYKQVFDSPFFDYLKKKNPYRHAWTG